MKTSTALGIATIGAAIAYRFLPKDFRDRAVASMEERMASRMEHAMEKLPDDAPPKLVKRGIPKLVSQNEEIIEMLREQNTLLQQNLQHQPAE